MKKEEFILYEMPWFVEFISIRWLQSIIAKYIARTVERKLYRLEKRKFRAEWLKNQPTTTS